MKKKFFAALLAILVLYAGWLAYEALSFRTRVNAAPEKIVRDPREIEGVYHIHTKFSDGTASVEDLVPLARKAGLDFLILTDHGNPNRKCIQSRGWKDGVLVLAGSELNVNRGHLVAMGFRMPAGNISGRAEEAVSEIGALGGFTVIAHPYSKVKWSWGEKADYSGLELINADTMFKNNLGRVLPYAPLVLTGSRLPLLKMLERPEPNLRKWDRLNAESPVFGYFSVDSHLYYKALFSFLHLHVLLDTPLVQDFDAAEAQVYAALRGGRFYNAIEAVAAARGFAFIARDGHKTYRMGDSAPAGAPLRLEIRAPFSFAKEVRLIHNGKTILASRDNTVVASAEGPGFYRVEVFLKERSPLGKNIPWIISNPIYVRKDRREWSP